MKTKVFFIILISAALSASGQTSIPGGNVSGTWTLAGSPYNIQGSIQITDGSSLIIEPGVTVSFQGAYKLLVLGRLLAMGTPADTITFTAADTITGWRSIRFDNTPSGNDTSKMMYCRLAYGKATGASPDDNGGGLYFNNFSKAIITNCDIIKCSANNNGGGIYCNGSSPRISGNVIVNNTSVFGQGGGIYCMSGNSDISNNVISGNAVSSSSVTGYGGGIFCSSGSPAIFNNLISNNTASISGAGIYSVWGTPSIYNNMITGNSTPGNGGGIYCQVTSDKTNIYNNIISYNTANRGGGISSSGDPIVSNNIISNNTAVFSQGNDGSGGGIYCFGSYPILLSNVISNNAVSSAMGYGGGIYCNVSSPDISNNTIVNNSAPRGGGLYCTDVSSPRFHNTILWGNTASTSGAQVFLNDESSDPHFYYGDVQGGTAAFDINGNFYTGTYQNNIDTDPLFVSPSGGSGTGFNGLNADWSLQSGSPCIDAGDPASMYDSVDFAGNPRVSGCAIDIGAFEYQVSGSLILTTTSTDASSCSASDGSATANVSGGTAPYTYLWSTGDTTSTVTGLAPGIYAVTITDSNNCIRTDSARVNCLLSVNQLYSRATISAYPNPFSLETTLQTEEAFTNAILTIYNSLGQQVKQVYNLSGQSVIFKRDNLPGGLYFYLLTEGNRSYADKLVIIDR